jgi:hypothetical protein
MALSMPDSGTRRLRPCPLRPYPEYSRVNSYPSPPRLARPGPGPRTSDTQHSFNLIRWAGACEREICGGNHGIQGYLTYKNTHPFRTLP